MHASKTSSFRSALLLTALVPLFGCDSELVKGFKAHESTMCECADAECAKAEHTKFLASWEAMGKAEIDWQSDAGKKDKKAIEKAVKGYRECLGKHVSAADATAVCQEDADAKKSSEACTTCCNREGRFFKTWVDPMAAGIAGALGAGDVKGCTCS
ncbi:MAG: hypothetical protein ACE37F_17150 [Nannocystaceae bacterium]|nr:hypothetical protein [bacterium]